MTSQDSLTSRLIPADAPRTEINKVWGYELHLVNTPHYAAKLLIVNPGFQCSLHYHRTKRETFLVTAGRVHLEGARALRAIPVGGLEGYSESVCEIVASLEMAAGDQVVIVPWEPHRFWALDNAPAEILEVSTHDDPDDSYRLEVSCARESEEDNFSTEPAG